MNKKLNWQIIRTLLFIIIGLFNTVLIRPEDIGTWKNYLGYALLIIAVFDIISIIRQILTNKNKSKDIEELEK
jgi:hypothetical protein